MNLVLPLVDMFREGGLSASIIFLLFQFVCKRENDHCVSPDVGPQSLSDYLHPWNHLTQHTPRQRAIDAVQQNINLSSTLSHSLLHLLVLHPRSLLHCDGVLSPCTSGPHFPRLVKEIMARLVLLVHFTAEGLYEQCSTRPSLASHHHIHFSFCLGRIQ